MKTRIFSKLLMSEIFFSIFLIILFFTPIFEVTSFEWLNTGQGLKWEFSYFFSDLSNIIFFGILVVLWLISFLKNKWISYISFFILFLSIILLCSRMFLFLITPIQDLIPSYGTLLSFLLFPAFTFVFIQRVNRDYGNKKLTPSEILDAA